MGGWERKEHSSILLTYSQVGARPHTSIPPEKNACWARPHPNTQSSKVTLELQMCNIQIPYVALLFLFASCQITGLQSVHLERCPYHSTSRSKKSIGQEPTMSIPMAVLVHCFCFVLFSELRGFFLCDGISLRNPG